MSLEDINYSSLESSSENKEGSNSISEAVREMVAEQERQLKKVSTQIKNSKAQHKAYAKFLSFLFGTLQSKTLVQTLYKLFFTIKDPHHGTIYKRKSTNYRVIIGMFAPFFWEKIEEYQMRPLYSTLYDPETIITPASYVQYLKKLGHTMHDQIALDQQLLIQTILLIFQEFNIIQVQHMEQNETLHLISMIQQELG